MPRAKPRFKGFQSDYRPKTGPTEAQKAAAATAERKRRLQAALKKKTQKQEAAVAAERKRRLQAMLGQREERDRRAAAVAAERKRRLQASLRRRVQHTVAKGEGIEQIGQKYGIEGREALDQLGGIERLRPGQVLKLDVPAEDGVTPRADLSGLEGGPQTPWKGSRAQRIADFRKQQLFGNQYGLGFGLGQPTLQEALADAEGEQAQVGVLGAESDLASGGGFIDTQRDLDRYVLGQVQEKWGAIDRDEKFAAGQENLARLIYGRLGEALMEGDLSKRVDYITPHIWSLFPAGLQKIYREQLGYYQRADGVWVPADFPEEELAVPEEDWGEGDGAGGGGGGRGRGGGGGRYVEETRVGGGSSYRGGRSGGITRLDVRQLTVGGLSPAKWRI